MVIYKPHMPAGKKGNSLAVPAREKVVLLSGNEAIARGAYEAGVTVASAYPGTPSTEILENFARDEGVYAEWAPNEKGAVEVPLREASASWEAKEFTRLAFDLSEKFDPPVFLRSTTRISHAEGAVRLGDVTGSLLALGVVRDPAKWVMLPATTSRPH